MIKQYTHKVAPYHLYEFLSGINDIENCNINNIFDHTYKIPATQHSQEYLNGYYIVLVSVRPFQNENSYTFNERSKMINNYLRGA